MACQGWNWLYLEASPSSYTWHLRTYAPRFHRSLPNQIQRITSSAVFTVKCRCRRCATIKGKISLVLWKTDHRASSRDTFHGRSALWVVKQRSASMDGIQMRDKGPHEKFCQECGSIIRAKAEICPKCGVRQNGASSTGRSRIGAALFAILLGWMGAHKFYLGKSGQGVLYLLFCWTGIPLIVSVIEGIIYLTMTDEAFSKKYDSE